MIEVALIFDREGRTIGWHQPPGGDGASIPDSRWLWERMWESRERLGGVAHTHPCAGEPRPSLTDVTTWSACERALGRRLVWPIVTADREAHFAWRGPDRPVYARIDPPPLRLEGLDELRRRSGMATISTAPREERR